MNVQDYVWPLKVLQEPSVVTYFSSWRGSEGKKQNKKNTPPFKSCGASHFVCRLSSCLWNSQCLSKHDETWDQRGASNDLSLLQGSSLSRRAMPEYPHRTNLILNRAPFMWATPSVCEEVPRCMWNLMRGNKRKREEKKHEGQKKFSTVKAQEEDKESSLSLSLCFILL